MTQSQFTPGDRVTWSYVPRGSQGDIIPIGAVVTGVTAKCVQIRIVKNNGDTITAHVRPKNLKLKKEMT